jgi:hypothetical protein
MLLYPDALDSTLYAVDALAATLYAVDAPEATQGAARLLCQNTADAAVPRCVDQKVKM